MSKAHDLANVLQLRLERAVVRLAEEQQVPWNRHVRLVVGNFSRSPKTRSDMWGRTGMALDPFGKRKIVYVNVRCITEAIPGRYLHALERAEEPSELAQIANRLNSWMDSWINDTLAPRVLRFGLELQNIEPHQTYAEGRNLWHGLHSPTANAISRGRRKHAE